MPVHTFHPEARGRGGGEGWATGGYVEVVKIAQVESLHADGGGRAFDFLKITADDGLVGWSEYKESFGGLGVGRSSSS